MIRYNADGVDGLCDQPKGHHPEKLDESEQAVLLAKIFQGPDLTRDGTCAWTLADLCDFVEARFDKRLKWAYIFGAAAPETGEAFGLVLPRADTLAMSVFLAEIAKPLPENQHAVMALDQAGWHGANALEVLDNVTLVTLPRYNPELDPVERLWLYLRQRFLSLRVFDRSKRHYRRLLPSLERRRR